MTGHRQQRRLRLDLQGARRTRDKLERTGHVRVRDAIKLKPAFRVLGLPLLEAETGMGVSGTRAYIYGEHWAMPDDLAAAEALYALVGDEMMKASVQELNEKLEKKIRDESAKK